MIWLALLLGIATADAKTPPPKVYIDKGACPFECCTYREWTARKEIHLVDRPNGKTEVGVIKAGQPVKAITGEVHAIPHPMDVVFKHGKFKVGERVYLLTYEGEGIQKVWFNGKVTSEEVMFPYNLVNEDKSCQKPSAECWGRLQGKLQSTWWIQIQLENGKAGWTSESHDFDNQDACG
jgi:hypothetical protein